MWTINDNSFIRNSTSTRNGKFTNRGLHIMLWPSYTQFRKLILWYMWLENTTVCCDQRSHIFGINYLVKNVVASRSETSICNITWPVGHISIRLDKNNIYIMYLKVINTLWVYYNWRRFIRHDQVNLGPGGDLEISYSGQMDANWLTSQHCWFCMWCI